ncbi:Uncharacterised protein [BD1-7 clade bacterium]|uniref:Uncharacterized protein n=1 Tax=BD1-7 clade bacterium TaxID=2029982 RepID=A0A5S9N0D8_9GAMM|nr:Uncharacterised protein [BD1-7 clade bacterium]CAA0083055.1 Uncharacterised protein [BD1-7 clade bacterium]
MSASTYVLNGTDKTTDIRINGGNYQSMSALNLQTGSLDQTTKFLLDRNPAPGTLGLGENEVIVKINGTITTYTVTLADSILITFDVQLIVFENTIEPKNTISTEGFTVTLTSQSNATLAISEAQQTTRCVRHLNAFATSAAETLQFTRIATNEKAALYQSDLNPTKSGTLAFTFFYRFADGSDAPEVLSLQASYDDKGAYVFTDDNIASESLLTELNSVLTSDSLGYSRVAWRRNSDDYNVIQVSVVAAIVANANFEIGTWNLLLAERATLTLEAETQSIVIQNVSGEQNLVVQVKETGVPQPVGSNPSEVLIPLAGDQRGSMILAWDWGHYSLSQHYGGSQRLFFGNSTEKAEVAQYPLFIPAPDPGPFADIDLYFHVYLQPLAELDDNRTRFSLDLQQENKLTAHYLSTTTNTPVSLTPDSNAAMTAGFGWAINAGDEASDRYLCPVGAYAVVGDGAEKRLQIRGGVSGTEYVLVEANDVLTFKSRQPAFAQGYTPDGSAPVKLDDTLTTSWVEVSLRQQQATADGTLIDTSYCAQSSASTYFGAELNPSYQYPIAVGASLLRFSEPTDLTLFPMLPYGGVFYSDADQGIESPNPDLSADNLDAIEQQLIAPLRRSTLQPFFDAVYGPIFFDTSTSTALEGGYARTPLGLVAGLNTSVAAPTPAGTIKDIILATSPQIQNQRLVLTANDSGVVNPVFSNNTLNDTLFMVATDADALAPFANEIKLGDFTYEVNLGNQTNQAIAIFKFIPGVSARTLINDTYAWTSLTGDTPDADVQKRLQAYIQAADEGGDLFEAFRQMIDNPNWNGLLIFNCPLDYQALPLDIQILLGGICGQLRAHHFGVNINRVGADGANVEYSSLFSVINYESIFGDCNPPSQTGDPSFQVLKLNVRYANSKLAVFDSQIAFSIQRLFESQVTLSVCPPTDYKDTGTIVIDGVYTLNEDGTGSLVFATTDLRSYTYDADSDTYTPLTAQSVTNAALVPVTRKVGTGDCTTIAKSAFRIDGLLAFQADVGGDLFSFGVVVDGVPSEGLAITAYAFDMDTCIKSDNTAEILGTIAANIDNLKVDQVLTKARENSFDETFPSQIQSLISTPDGLTPARTGDWQVSVSGSDFDASPRFSLVFDVPMGILGMLLSTKTDLTARIMIGWDPQGKDNKQVGAVLQLPSEVAGPGGFEFQGIISTSFERVDLNRITLSSGTGGDDVKVYALYFVYFQGSLLNLLFNYDLSPKDLGFFGGPTDPGGSNSLFFVGKSTGKDWKGPTMSVTLEDVPSAFLGRSYEIKTDPTNPNVISDAYDKLNPLVEKTVEEFINIVYANRSLYNADAGIAFGLQFDFKSLALTALLHDSSFYGAQIKITPSKDKKGDDSTKKVANDSHRELNHIPITPNSDNASVILAEDSDGEEKMGFLDQVEGLTFTIIYRKVSDQVGVWSADIYLNLGTINIGTFSLSLPNFSVSIWTNGDWRFAIGWPFTGSNAHPITIQFQAGPIPVIGQAGFYLGKLSSAAAPDQFGDEFNLIWSFGAGVSGGVGKKFKEGPLSAEASVMLSLIPQGFLASFDGKMTDDGVDYWWWGIGLSLTGKVGGKVDFKIIVVQVSLTISVNLAFAIETAHKTPLTMNVTVEAKASIKIVFVKISFSFKTKLDLFTFTFGNGPTASLSGPTPQAAAALFNSSVLTREAIHHIRQTGDNTPHNYRAPGPAFTFDINTTTPETIVVDFLLQTTSISQDGSTWAPQGVATLVLESGDQASPFGKLSKGLAQWLVSSYGGDGSFDSQLAATAAALEDGRFNDAVESALSEMFVFAISAADYSAETATVGMVMPTSLVIAYNNTSTLANPLHACLADNRLPGNYEQMVHAYFEHGRSDLNIKATEDGDGSIAQTLFDGYFVVLSQQLIQLLIETGAPDLDTALSEISLSDLGGFVSRFIMGGVRLPDPTDPNVLTALYLLTSQQFGLQKSGDNWVLDAAIKETGDTPDWITVASDTTSRLDDSMVHTIGPQSQPWTIEALPPLALETPHYPINNNTNWQKGDGVERIINLLSEDIKQGIFDWQNAQSNDGGPWLSLVLQSGDDTGGQADLSAPGTPWEASAALSLSVELAGIPDGSGEPGAILPNIFSILGTNEADRTLLQDLLDDVEAGLATIDFADLLASASRGNWESTKAPEVLVRTDLSTNSLPPAMTTDDGEGGTQGCANYAKPAEGGDELIRFLRLIWEVSVNHSTGFFLQVDGLDLSQFETGPANFTLLIGFGETGSTVAAKGYQNALVGKKPDADSGIFATLASDDDGTPIQAYVSAYPGGDVGWNISWQDAPDEAAADSGDYLLSLYQMASYRIEAINDKPVDNPWSRPLNAENTTPEGSDQTQWNFHTVISNDQLNTSGNRYASVGDTINVAISMEDVFGNSLPDSMVRTIDLDIVYNDNIQGISDWPGSQASYVITNDKGVILSLNLAFDPTIVQDSDGNVDPDQLARTVEQYALIKDQLMDPNMNAGISTAEILNSGLIIKQIDQSTVISGLVAYIDGISAWLATGTTGTAPAASILSAFLEKDYPTNWPGDLQQLTVSLALTRDHVTDDIAEKMPDVRHVSTPVQPVEQASTEEDPSGLTSFADNFELAYFPFDGSQGVIKVATGTDNDITSQTFGRRSIWIQRWSDNQGTSVKILNDDDHPPIFYAPPPLSTQLITRTVDDLRNYSDPDNWTPHSQVFSSIDLDVWGENFLATVETLFSPTKSTATADASTPQTPLYDPFVANKESLAESVSSSIEYVYDEAEGTGDPSSARETWRQALLRTLNNDYGFSTLTQLEALVKLNGEIEPDGDPNNPPLLFGAVEAAGGSDDKALPYALTPATLPLTQGTNWLNTLVSARDPSAQRAFTLDLDYQVNQIEHHRDGLAAKCGYTPSNWLTFILQQNPAEMPQGQDNTLTQPIGTTRIPIPLRTYPPLPKLLQAAATKSAEITTIADAMTWNLDLTIERSNADQDTLNLLLSFNEQQNAFDIETPTLMQSIDRSAPKDLVEALARFEYEYPQLAPYIDAIVTNPTDQSIAAMQEFSSLIGNVATAWASWVSPQALTANTLSAKAGGDPEVWHFAIQDVENSTDLQVKASWSIGDSAPPWPTIEGYSLSGSPDANTAIYTPDSDRLQTLKVSWRNFYVLDYQNVVPQAYTERNRNLALPPQDTNPNFIYRTETVSWPTPIVPLLVGETVMTYPSGDSLSSAINTMLLSMMTPPEGSQTNGSSTQLAYESAIEYRYAVMANKGDTTYAQLPVFLLEQTVSNDETSTAAKAIADNLKLWQQNTQASSTSSSLKFVPTVFATTIVSDSDRLPLVQFAGLAINIPDDKSWWD